jgi:hypothetical protein
MVGMLGTTALAMSVVCACGLVAATVLSFRPLRANEVVR